MTDPATLAGEPSQTRTPRPRPSCPKRSISWDFYYHSRVLTLTEIAKASGLHTSTVHRLLAKVIAMGVIEEHGNAFRVGSGCCRWSGRCRREHARQVPPLPGQSAQLVPDECSFRGTSVSGHCVVGNPQYRRGTDPSRGCRRTDVGHDNGAGQRP